MTGATGLRRLAAASATLLLVATLQIASPTATQSASASTVTPIVVDGNPTCSDFDADGTMLKLEGAGELDAADSGTYSAGDLSVTVDISSTDMGSVFDWTANQPIDVVVAKGGPMANVYHYGGSTADTDLHAPLNPATETWYGLSHISFCTGDTTETTPTTGGTTSSTLVTVPSTSKTTPTSRPALGAIGDYVWLDVDKDGAQGDPAVEEPVAGATVQLLTADGTLLDSRMTGVDGLYLFDGLSAGNYRVQVVFGGAVYTVARAPGVSNAVNSDVDPLGNGVGRTAPINLSAGEVDLTWDAGIVLDVLGVQIESTTTLAPVTLATLPFTGSSDGSILAAAAIVALVGAAALVLIRRDPAGRGSLGSIEGWTNR